MQLETTLVILGAGASYDSFSAIDAAGIDLDTRPPLTKDIFDLRPTFRRVLNRHPEAKVLAARLRDDFKVGKNLEALLDEVVEEGNVNPSRPRELLEFRRYLAAIISWVSREWQKTTDGQTNYLRLVDALDHWCCRDPARRRVVFVTFNYDTLLESALGVKLGLKLDNMSKYTDHGRFSLIKPHGSVAWQQYVEVDALIYGNDQREALLANAASLDARLSPPRFPIAENRGNLIGIPAIMIPLQKKAAPICPKEHLKHLESMLPSVTRVLTIGWAGKESHFNAHFDGKLPSVRSLAVVAANQTESQGIAEQLIVSWGLGRPGRVDGSEGGFSLSLRHQGFVQQALS